MELTSLQEYFTFVSNLPRKKDVPRVSKDLLGFARNAVKSTPRNNDLLEFVGDRMVNLATTILVDRVKVTDAHLTNVRRVICNNDTLGRLSFALRLHENAKLNSQDAEEVDLWNPLSKSTPPKPLADLFEAYCGAVFIEHGWILLLSWLEILFQPIIKVATKDYWYSRWSIPGGLRGLRYKHASESTTERKLLDFIWYKRDLWDAHGSEAFELLPLDAKFSFDSKGLLEDPFCGYTEIGVHVLNMWTCQFIITLWPEYHQAKSKAAHLATAITGLVVNERTMSYLASHLSMKTYICVPRATKTADSPTANNKDVPSYPLARDVHLWTAFKAFVGWYYRKAPEKANTWGEALLKPIVIRAHDILVQDRRNRPIMPTQAESVFLKSFKPRHSSPSPTKSSEDTLEVLTDALKGMTLKSRSTRKPQEIGSTESRPSSDSAKKTSSKWQGVGLSPTQDNFRAGSENESPRSKSDHSLDDLTRGLSDMSIGSHSSEPRTRKTKKYSLDDMFERPSSSSPSPSGTSPSKEEQSPDASTSEEGSSVSEVRSTNNLSQSRKWKPIVALAGPPEDKENEPQVPTGRLTPHALNNDSIGRDSSSKDVKVEQPQRTAVESRPEGQAFVPRQVARRRS